MKQRTFILQILLILAAVNIVIVFLFLSFNKQEPDIEELMKHNDYGAVVDLGERLLEEDPENIRIHELVIQALIRMRDYQQLKTRLREALDIIPEDNALCHPIVEFLKQEGKHKIARNVEKEYCEREPHEQKEKNAFRQIQERGPESRPERRSFHRQKPPMKKPSEEESHDDPIYRNKQRLKKDPWDIKARENLSAAYIKIKDYDRAQEILIESLEMDRENPIFPHQMAEVLEQKGEYRNAARMLWRFIRKTNDGALKEKALKRIIDLEAQGHR